MSTPNRLLPASVACTIPALYATEGDPDALAIVRLYTPDGNWEWYVCEYDPETEIAFGVVVGFEVEIGYFSLAEIAEVRGRLGLAVERDEGFEAIRRKVKWTPLSRQQNGLFKVFL